MMTIEEAKAHLTAKPDLDIFRRAIEILENREYTVYSCHALSKAIDEKLGELTGRVDLWKSGDVTTQWAAWSVFVRYKEQYELACRRLGTYNLFWNRVERLLVYRVEALNNFIKHAELAGMTKEPT